MFLRLFALVGVGGLLTSAKVDEDKLLVGISATVNGVETYTMDVFRDAAVLKRSMPQDQSYVRAGERPESAGGSWFVYKECPIAPEKIARLRLLLGSPEYRALRRHYRGRAGNTWHLTFFTMGWAKRIEVSGLRRADLPTAMQRLIEELIQIGTLVRDCSPSAKVAFSGPSPWDPEFLSRDRPTD
jgi:hypothetical protein